MVLNGDLRLIYLTLNLQLFKQSVQILTPRCLFTQHSDVTAIRMARLEISVSLINDIHVDVNLQEIWCMYTLDRL